MLLKSVYNIYKNILKNVEGGYQNMLFRKIQKYIEDYMKSDTNKILIIDGARQIGKTYIIRYTGEKLFENYIEINMVEYFLGNKLFENVKTVDDFYLQVSMIAGEKMKDKENITREQFNYTNWQESLFADMSVRDLSNNAMKYATK